MPQSSSNKRMIGSDEYEVFMLPPRVSMAMMVDLGKVIGPAMESIGDSEAENHGMAYMKIVSAIMSNVEKPMLNSVCDRLAEVSTVNGMPLNKVFDSHFLGKMGALMQWITFALETQFSDFFSALGSASGQVRTEEGA